jgi:hypothetical protein
VSQALAEIAMVWDHCMMFQRNFKMARAGIEFIGNQQSNETFSGLVVMRGIISGCSGGN